MIRLILITVILGILSAFGYGLVQYGISKERAEWRWQAQKAVEAARIDERAKQEAVNHVIQAQYDEISTINDNLVNDLSELRDRPPRPKVSSDTGIACTGQDGRALSKDDAEFLIRLSSIAERQQAALKACYTAYDSLLD